MKTERARTQKPAADAFRAFFDTVDRPAALCDAHLTVLAANPAFEALCGVTGLAGKSLTDCVQSPLAVPAEGPSQDVEVTCQTGQQVTLTLARRGDTVAVLASSSNTGAIALAATGRALIEQARVEQALLELGRMVVGSTSEEDLVASVAKGVKGLFPGRAFCVRIIDPRNGALTSLYAEGRLREGARDTIVLRKSMVEKTNLKLGALPAERVKVTTGELPLVFTSTTRGISAPLVASGQLFGALNVEYPEGLSADVVADERVLIQLANQVSVAVRNVKLIDELTFVRKYLEELLEHANALIMVANRDGRVVVFNRLFSQLTGLQRSEVLGRPFLDFVPESERLKVMRLMAAALRGEAVSTVETAVISPPDGEVRVALATSTVLAQSGEVEGVIAIGQDLTRMRELEKRVIQAEKLASLGQLAATVVHEINNPMTAVATYADALLKRSMGTPGADPADQEKFRKIVDGSERVLRFTRDLVSYARPAQDKAEEIDLSALLDRALGFCEHVLNKHGIKVEKKYGEVPRFLGVKGNLVQVFVNLITNACHATPSGGTVTLETTAAADWAEVCIRDTGAGIGEAVLPRIFEPFFTTKPDGKGTGLGLSIVQGIVERHGGTISVESTLGKGTAFRIRLPMVRG